MMRRLYFLFPSKTEAQAAVSTLSSANIRKRFMHTLARSGLNLDGLPQASLNQQHNFAYTHCSFFLEWRFTVFSLSLIGLLISLIFFYAIRIPEVVLADFQYALSHDEILLMVDVPKKELHKIESLMHRRHPAANSEGSSWTLDVMGIWNIKKG